MSVQNSKYHIPWVTVTLRHESYCRICGKKMVKGEEVEWKPSMGACTFAGRW